MKKRTTRKITNHAGETVTVTFTVDFAGASEDQMAEWALSNRIIAGQKVWRNLSAEAIRKLVDGKTFDARTIGRKIENPEEAIQKIEQSIEGMDAKAAAALLEKLKNKIKSK